MKIAIIGAGNVGRALAGASLRAGHDVTISSASGSSAEMVAADTGATAVASNKAAAEGADLVVLAVPYPELVGVLDDLGDGVRGKVLVDATNPLKPDYSGLATEGTSAAEQIQARVQAYGAHVVKALNSVLAARQAQPRVDDTVVDGFVAGDDEAAKAKVLEYVRSLGLHPLDAGPLAMARALEAMALLNIMLQIKNDWSWQTGWKLVGPTKAA
jgi:NADPH-dependent F420 reductase